MTVSQSNALQALLAEFEGPWRDDTPVFACCRRSVASVLDRIDMHAIAPLDAVARVHALREALEADQPGHLDAHRCCAGHLADLAFDLPDLLAPAGTE